MTDIVQAFDPVVGVGDAGGVDAFDWNLRQSIEPQTHPVPLAPVDEGFRVSLVSGVGEQQRNNVVEVGDFGDAALLGKLIEYTNPPAALLESLVDGVEPERFELFRLPPTGSSRADKRVSVSMEFVYPIRPSASKGWRGLRALACLQIANRYYLDYSY
ncbi:MULTISPECIES: hypothetical protein [unclassified Mycobacterium]|uniref:hypothetical protein n=1 Tax=unclassified Mycobacterium TaxID=2642494 RepID=UPI0029C69E77|nr:MULTISPECIES: hypothetical protein [unclassified Mycobacterium]